MFIPIKKTAVVFILLPFIFMHIDHCMAHDIDIIHDTSESSKLK